MLTTLLPILLATVPTPTTTTTPTTPTTTTPTTTDPILPRHVTVGVRTLAIADTSWFIPDLRHTGGGLGVFGGSTIGERVEVRLGVDGRSVDEGLSYCLERCGHPGVQPQKNPADAGLVRAIDTAWPQPNRLGSTSRKTGSLSSSWLKSPSSMPPRSSIANKRWARDKWATGLLLA